MTKKLRLLTKDEWLNDFSAFVGKETQKLLKGYAKTHEQPAEALVNRYIKYLISATLTEVLGQYHEHADTMTKEEAFKKTFQAYKNFKHTLETEIADAFTEASANISKNAPEYYCEIAIMPEPINTKPV